MRHRHRIVPLVGGAAILTASLVAVGPTAPGGAAEPDRSGVPDIAELAGPLADQQLKWEKCRFTGSLRYWGLFHEWSKMEDLTCTTVKVPQDWHDPDPDKTFDIAVSRLTQARPARRDKGAILINPGGPGGPGVPMAPAIGASAPDLLTNHDLVGFDPRGVGKTADGGIDGQSSEPRSAEEAKLINTEQTVYDMDFIRYLLGEKKLNYLGFSYGTWLGTWYGQVFGANAGKMVLDSAADVTEPSLQRTFKLQSKGEHRIVTEQIVPYLTRHRKKFSEGGKYDIPKKPKRAVKAFVAGAGGRGQTKRAYDTCSYLNGPNTGRPSDFDVIAKCMVPFIDAGMSDETIKAQRLPANSASEESGAGFDYVGPFQTIYCNDGPWTKRDSYWTRLDRRQNRKFYFAGSVFGGRSACEDWPAQTEMPGVTDPSTFPNVLVIQSELDYRTALEAGRRTANTLPGASTIFVDNEAGHGLFPYSTECVDEPVYRFFKTGYLQKRRRVCPGLPIPGENKTFQAWGKLTKRGFSRPVLNGRMKRMSDGKQRTAATATEAPATASEATAREALNEFLTTVNAQPF